jgi:hypothetical protein
MDITKTLEIYLTIVYSKFMRQKYSNKVNIDDALTVEVHSSVKKIEPSAPKSFTLKF